MALTCSLLGHAFDDYEVVRDREERGSEVVTSIREVAVCDRCGAERVLSENTEVTSIVDAPPVDDMTDGADGATDDRFAPTETAEAASVETAGTGDDAPDPTTEGTPTDEGAELVENDGPSDVGGLEDTTAAPEDAVDTASEDDASSPATEAEAAEVAEDRAADGRDAEADGVEDDDDAIILTDAPEEREYGEWPSHDGQQYRPWDPDDLLEDPDETDDEGPTVAEMMGATDRDGAADDGSSGREAGAGTGDTGPEFEETAALADGETTLQCPNCGFQSPARAVSLRHGDACPDCRTGYLVTERNP